MSIENELEQFLREVGKNPIAKQALADAIASGAFPTENGKVVFTIEGLKWMERREEELRAEAN